MNINTYTIPITSYTEKSNNRASFLQYKTIHIKKYTILINFDFVLTYSLHHKTIISI